MSKETVFKVGQRVFSLRDGWGVVFEIEDVNIYPISVHFDNKLTVSYDYSGREYVDYDKYPILSFTNYIEDRFSLDPKDAKYDFKLEFDWDCLPKWANKYIAKDRDGSWCAYNEEPIKDEFYGVFDGSNYVDIPKEYEPLHGERVEWNYSIFKNPNHD